MKTRAMLYLRRRYKRTLLLLILLFLVTASLFVGISIYGNINAVVKEVQQSLGTSFIFKARMNSEDPNLFEMRTTEDGLTARVYIGPQVDQKLVDDILQIDGIKAYNAEVATYIHLENAIPIPGSWARGLKSALLEPESRDVRGILTLDHYKMYSKCIRIFGNTDTSLNSDFRSGAFTLVEGRHLAPGDRRKVLISEEFADSNQLCVGDTIEISTNEELLYARDPAVRVGDIVPLEIIGIYHVNGSQTVNEWVVEWDIVYNKLLVDNETVHSIATQSEDTSCMPFSNVTFFVDDPAELETVLHKAQEVDTIDSYYYDISIDDADYRATVDPLNSIKLLVLISTLVIVIGCAIVLSVVFTMWVRTRRREIGILVSLGIRKSAIVGQLLLEAGIVAVAALLLTAVSVQSVPDMLGNQLLSSAAAEQAPEETPEYTPEQIQDAIFDGTLNDMYAFQSGYTGPEHLDFDFGLTDWLLLAALELLLILLTIARASRFVYKLQPRQILIDLS